ncbi:MAG TPA: hypothetical protein PKM50_06770, partial [Methanoregula sp.]|nr:hypothetical protein [Methanoregula sp.]
SDSEKIKVRKIIQMLEKFGAKLVVYPKIFIMISYPHPRLREEGASCFALKHKEGGMGAPLIYIVLRDTPSLNPERCPPPFIDSGGGG